MSFYHIVKSLNCKQLFSLFVWFLRHPFYTIATIQATVQAFQLSQKKFPDIHGRNNKANAFRHAFWNLLIAKKCARFSGSMISILTWTKKITDWHEEFTPNNALAKAMDLQNNQVGREMYVRFTNRSVEEMTSTIIAELDEAIKISAVSEIVRNSGKMVYIED
tara:strand:- start:255 stop:743 length:489 start_codon:yes stop_codon:yes gene_type:complete